MQRHKIIANIVSFDPKKSYPQFGRKEELKPIPSKLNIKVKPAKKHRPVAADIKAAKAEWKKSQAVVA